MSKDIPRYFIGVGLPSPWQENLNKIKRSYHPQHRLTSPAHITLKRPFWIPNNNTQRLTAQLAKWGRKRRPFGVTLEKIGSFKKRDYAVVFLHPDKGRHLKKLDYTLDEAVDFLPENKQFIPHLTLAQRVRKKKLRKVKRQLRELDLKIEFEVSKIQVYKLDPGGSWEEWRGIEFQG